MRHYSKYRQQITILLNSTRPVVRSYHKIKAFKWTGENIINTQLNEVAIAPISHYMNSCNPLCFLLHVSMHHEKS